jgi:hypothetical protein
MTAKESLRLLLDELSEEDAARLLSEAEKLTAHANGSRTAVGPETARPPIWEVIQQIAADLTEADLASIPAATDVDRVVYGAPDELA